VCFLSQDHEGFTRLSCRQTRTETIFPKIFTFNVHFHFVRAQKILRRGKTDKSIQMYVNSKGGGFWSEQRTCTEYKFSFFTCGFMSIFILHHSRKERSIKIKGQTFATRWREVFRCFWWKKKSFARGLVLEILVETLSF
jgi:hypothetical protein